METISTFDPHTWGKVQYIETPVRWKRREWGGWTLVHAKTGRLLGWIVRNPDDARAWDVRLCSQAFRGDQDGDGDILDKVPAYLYNGNPHDEFVSNCVNTTRDRLSAAEVIVSKLINRRAPAVGYGRHPEVDTTKSDRYRKLAGATA